MTMDRNSEKTVITLSLDKNILMELTRSINADAYLKHTALTRLQFHYIGTDRSAVTFRHERHLNRIVRPVPELELSMDRIAHNRAPHFHTILPH